MLLFLKFKERDTTIGPHIPMQWPKPTVKPVAMKTKYKVSIDDIENKLRSPHARNGHSCFPDPFPAGASNNDPGPFIDTFFKRLEGHPVGSILMIAVGIYFVIKGIRY